MRVEATPKGIKGMPGLMTDDELALLCRMARSARSVVELGTWQGRSLAAMMLASPGIQAWAVDWFEDMTASRGYPGSSEATVREHLGRLGLTPAGIISATTMQAAGMFEETVDLLHIDAGHSYEECKADLEAWAPKVRAGGAICVHDYGEPHNPVLRRPGVQQAVDEWRNPAWVEVERAGTMVAFRHLLGDEGALYVAYGDKAREQATASMASLREHAPGLPAAVVSDAPLEGADVDVYHVEADRGARAQKTRMYSLSPWRQTLFLDADTRLLQSPAAGFGLLQYGDVALAQDPVRLFSANDWPYLDQAEVMATKEEVPAGGELLYWNSGVVFFGRGERVQRLMQEWHRQWMRNQKHDQMALLRAIHRAPARIVAMREAWNSHRRERAQFVFHAHRQARREGAPR